MAEEGEASFNERRRNDIIDARRNVREQREALKDALITGRINESQARELFATVVKSYIAEAEAILRTDTDPDTTDRLTRDWWADDLGLGSVSLPDGKAYAIESLKEYFHQSTPIEHQYTTTDHDALRGKQTRRKKMLIHPPMEVSWRASRVVSLGLADVGLELGFEETPTDEADPDDLRALLKARGQDEALENLPNRFLKEETNGEHE